MRAANAGPRSPPLPSPLEAAIRGGARFSHVGSNHTNGGHVATVASTNGVNLNQPPLTSTGSTASSTASSSGYSSINDQQQNNHSNNNTNTSSTSTPTNGHDAIDYCSTQNMVKTNNLLNGGSNRVAVPSLSSGSTSTTSSGTIPQVPISPARRVCFVFCLHVPASAYLDFDQFM